MISPVVRRWFVVDVDESDRDATAAAWGAVVDVLGESLDHVEIDAYTGHGDALPDDARAAQAALARRGARVRRLRRWNDPGLFVPVATTDDEWPLASTFAPWSIHVSLVGRGAHPGFDVGLGAWHDGGGSVTLLLTDDEARALSGRLGPGVVGPLPERPSAWQRLLRRSLR